MRTLPNVNRGHTDGAAAPSDRPRPTSPTAWPGHAILDSPEAAQILHAAWSGDPGVVVPSPPGAGKTRLVALLAAALAERAGMRVGIAGQTRTQVIDLANRIGTHTDRARLLWSRTAPRPTVATPIITAQQSAFPPDHGGVLIATTARWLRARSDRLGCDLMIVDEAYQATYADLGALGAFAPQVVCVGDPGQIDPVVTGNTTRWVGSATGPHLPAPQALCAAHGDAIAVVPLRYTWRLGPDTTAVIQPTLYPDLPFTSRRPPENLVGGHGEPLPELTSHVVSCTAGPTDPDLLDAAVGRVRALLSTATLHREGQTRPLTPDDIAVVTPHVNQAAAVHAGLSDVPGLLIGTANQLQGMERAAVVVVHPLAGYREITDFNTDTGRMCVMLSRHRVHATVIVDEHTPTALAAADPGPVIATHVRILDHVCAASV